jgi:RimJ/RimL family protein N-acetyltransferase
MRELDLDLEMRPATIDDAEIVADLEAALDPLDPRDPVMFRFRWASQAAHEARMDLVAEHDGAAQAFVAAGHEPWTPDAKRYGWIRPALHPKAWSDIRFGGLIAAGESWLREQAGNFAVVRVRENFKDQLRVVASCGYREERRSKLWELDLVGRRDLLLAGAALAREHMKEQGIRLMTVDQDDDPDSLAKLYELTMAAERDVPTTVPWRTKPFEEWRHFWFENPGVRADRFWIAREGDAMIGLSVIGYPPTRGVPWTFFTGTTGRGRGRGVARALKYETLAQAIALGIKRVRTNNDGENAPILHLNEEIGYQVIDPVIEMHRELA